MGAKSSKRTAQNNRSDGHLLEYFRNTFVRGGGGTNATPPATGLTATGGVISDYTNPGPGAIYRAHIFTSSGTFTVSSIGSYGSNVEYLVVAGGGGGGGSSGDFWCGGGGGAGGFRTNVSGHPLAGSSFPISSGSYTVTVGGGGNGGFTGSNGTNGSNSVFATVTSSGGGGGEQ